VSKLVVPAVVEIELVDSTMVVVAEAVPVPDSVAVEASVEVGVGSSGPVEFGAVLLVAPLEVPVPVPVLATSSPQLESDSIKDRDRPEMRRKIIAPGNHRWHPGSRSKSGFVCIGKDAMKRLLGHDGRGQRRSRR
jgi:hypothetical protein